MYEYKAILDRVVDGDTIDVTIDLGFNVWKKLESEWKVLIPQSLELEI